MNTELPGTDAAQSVNPNIDPRTGTLPQRARRLHEIAVEQIDTATLQRLRAARLAAITPRPRRLLPVLVPAGALAAAVLAMAVIWGPLRGPPAAPADTDTSLIATAGSHEVDLAQNLDFYDWLATQQQPAPAASVQ